MKLNSMFFTLCLTVPSSAVDRRVTGKCSKDSVPCNSACSWKQKS